MVRRIAIVLGLVMLSSSVASATATWLDANIGDWTDGNNWSVGREPNNGESTDINNGTCTMDSTAGATQLLRLANSAATDSMKLVIDDPNAYLLVGKAGSGETFGVGRVGTAVVEHSAGTIKVDRPDADSGETRITGAATASGTYNLSGTGILDTEVLRKGSATNPGGFNATGGTLIIRTKAYRLGAASATQGGALFAPGGLGEVKVGSVVIGDGTYPQDWDTSDGVLEIDIASDASFDTVTQVGNCDTTDGELRVNLLGSYTPAPDSFFDVWLITSGGGGGGAFDSLPTNWTAEWKDLVGGDEVKETLRLTYIPEPATLSLLVLGGLALIRRRR